MTRRADRPMRSPFVRACMCYYLYNLPRSCCVCGRQTAKRTTEEDTTMGYMSSGFEDCEAATEVVEELRRARGRFPTFHSAHEGASILREEFEELWDVVKQGGSSPRSVKAMRKEAIQVAAMALRFIEDVCDKPEVAEVGTRAKTRKPRGRRPA